MNTPHNNSYNEQEIKKFNAQAHDFWQRDGAFKTLHQINPIRVAFIEEWMDLSGKRVADIGCGGGILAEALDEKGARVTGLDLSEVGITAAKVHQNISGSQVDYRLQSTHDFAAEIAAEVAAEVADSSSDNALDTALDGVFCMEMLEHVDSPSEIIADCAKMLKPGGLAVFSTINRTTKAHLLAVIAAEYILRMVPQGTHDADYFIKPSEMQRMADAAGLTALDIIGFEYQPLSDTFVRSHNTDINYIFAFRKRDEQ